MTNEIVVQRINIAKDKDLSTLYLSGNQLTQLPQEIGELKNLTILDLSRNQLTRLPPEIGELKNLSILDISRNQLTRLPPEIGELKNLTQLRLSNNQLTRLPPEIGKLKNLTTLTLFNNELTNLPTEIGELKNLTTLYLYHNQLTNLPPKIWKLKNLTILDLTRNQLTKLPLEILELENLTMLSVSNNPLTSPPPEIVSKGIGAIFTYLKQSKTKENNEAKLILVGNGEVGKTCLAYRLIHNKFFEDSKVTEGINISKWEIPAPSSKNSKIKLNIWDFGGQEIYHATHLFFLTERSVYLLVWNARKTKDYDNIYYWLHTIEAFGGDSPIILVMSKMNESDDDLNLEDLKNKFPQIIGYLKIDSKDGKGVYGLKEKIRGTAWNIPLMKVLWVDSWYKVREKLEEIGENWIKYEDFYKICACEGLDDENIRVLDGYLHDLGVTLHFKDSENLALKNIVILKPEWATGAFYQILSTKSVFHRRGILLHCELEHIWDKETYPPEIHPQLMELMNKFELAYELPNKTGYLVAELLPNIIPNFVWDGINDLCFYYCYDYFLPPGIITRFIVRMHQDIEKKEDGMPLCWREGAVLNVQKSRVIVKMKPDERQIEIKINGGDKRGVLGAICYQLDQINSSMKKIRVSKKIPCNCTYNCPERYSYDKLLKAEIRNERTIQCHESYQQVSISSLLSGYKLFGDKSGEHNEPSNNTFISIGEMKVSKDNIHIHDVVGSVNVKARLDHVTQTVYNAPRLEDTKKQELSELIEELRKALEPAASLNPDDTDRIIEDAERVAKEVSRENPSKSRLENIAGDLKETAKAVAEVAPAVLPIATRIATFVTGMF